MFNKPNQTSNVLYISNFPKKTTKQELQQLLEPCGVILSLNIIQKFQYAFAFVQFDDIRDAVFAVKQLDQKLYNGMNLKVQFKNRKMKENQEEFIKCFNKNQQNDHNSSPIQTNCSLPPQKIVEKHIIQSKAQQFGRKVFLEKYQQHEKNQKKIKTKIDKNLISQDYHSRSGSRSRQKDTKQKYSKKFHHKIRPSTDKRYRQRESSRSQSMTKYHSRIQSFRYQVQYDASRMFDLIKSLSSNIRKLEQKLSDFVFDYKHTMSYQPSRRR